MKTKSYIPSNGIEGEIFYHQWCAKCRRDAEWRENERNPCNIRALAHETDDPEYPAELVCTTDVPWQESNPRCTAFEPESQDVPINDSRQIGMEFR